MDNKVAEIAELLNASADIEPAQGADTPDGDQVQKPDDGGEGSQSGAVDTAEPDPTASVEDETEGEPQAAAEGDGEPVDPDALVPLSEMLPEGVEESEFYNGSGKKIGDEWVSFSQMADSYQAQQELAQREEQAKESVSESQREMLQMRTQLNEIMQVLPPEQLQQFAEQAKGRDERYRREQQQLVLETIPEWQNADTLARDRQAILEVASDFGFSEQEMAFTTDARAIRMLHEFAQLKRERAAALKAAGTAQPGKPNAPIRDGRKQNQASALRKKLEAAKTGGMQERVSGVAAILEANS